MSSLTALSHLSQVNGQLDELRQRLNEPIVPLTNDTILTISSQLQPLYKKLLITNLDEALNRQLETGLWNDCFKTPLTRFGRTDKNLFHLMIETGVGFYLGLIQDIGIHFDISFITNSSSTNKLYCTKTSQSPLVSPSKVSVYFIIQNCLLHVGDLLRYRGSFPEALKMYEKSAAVCPTNGYPYHQMGITQLLITSNDDYTTMNNIISTFYFYARALSVSNPNIPTYNSFDSLIKKLMSIPVGSNKYQELIRQFTLMIYSTLQLQADPLNSSSYNMVPMLSPLVTNQQIKASILFQMIVIALWAQWRHGSAGPDGCALSEELTLEIITGMLNSVLIAATALFGTGTDNYGQNNTEKRFYCITHLKLLLDWLSGLHQSDKYARQFAFVKEKTHVGTLVKFLNQIQSATQLDEGGAVNYILPEEKRLIGFLPLDYSSVRSSGGALLDESNPKTSQFRLHRILQNGIKLSTPNSSGQNLLEYDGLSFGEISSSMSTQISRRNVALTSIFRSQNSGGGGDAGPISTSMSLSVSISGGGGSGQNPSDIFRSIWTPADDVRVTGNEPKWD